MPTPFKNQFGIPLCPRCRITLPEGPNFCPACGMPLGGPKFRLKLFGRFLLMISIPLLISWFLIGRKSAKAGLPPSGEVTAQASEIKVEPDSTFWSMVEPQAAGQLVFRVKAMDAPIGMNLGPVGEKGFTPELDQEVRRTQFVLQPGQEHEMTLAVQPRRKYAVYVVNETDEAVQAHVTIRQRWGQK